MVIVFISAALRAVLVFLGCPHNLRATWQSPVINEISGQTEAHQDPERMRGEMVGNGQAGISI